MRVLSLSISSASTIRCLYHISLQSHISLLLPLLDTLLSSLKKTNLHLYLHCIPFSSSSAAKLKWNSNTKLLITNPVLRIMESCNSMAQLKQIHGNMTRTGLISHHFPISRVLAFCALSGSGDINHAHLLFAQIPEPNLFMWNTMIRGFSKVKIPKMGFYLFRQMMQECIEMDNRTFVFTLKTCEQFLQAVEGKSLHSCTSKLGFDLDLLVRNSLMHFYVKFGFLDAAHQLFAESLERDVISWTTLIDGYSQNNHPDEALKIFYLMVSTNTKPNEITMISVLSACARVGILSLGRKIHEYIEETGVSLSLNLLNGLLEMYVKCGCLDIAKELFDKMEIKDVFTWTSMINGYAKHGELKLARQLFDEMPERNVVSWNAMIAGYSQTNQPKEALDLFNEMKTMQIRPTEGTLVSVLSACAQSGCLHLGTWMYQFYVNEEIVELTVNLANAFIDMYAKCGDIGTATSLFQEMPERDLVSWNSMIAAYAVHGYGEKSLMLYEQMKSEGVLPDDITFVGVLSACSHCGWVVEGHNYFESMRRVYCVEPKLEHYACMIDLLGRVGNLEEAYELIKSMPMELDEAGWMALLNACRMHGNVDLGQLAAKKLLDLDPEDSGVYVLLANIYAVKNRWNNVKMVRRMMRARGVKKTPACSSVEVDGKFHEFLVGDTSHPLTKEIYRMLDEVSFQFKLEGYVPNISQLIDCDEVSELCHFKQIRNRGDTSTLI